VKRESRFSDFPRMSWNPFPEYTNMETKLPTVSEFPKFLESV